MALLFLVDMQTVEERSGGRVFFVFFGGRGRKMTSFYKILMIFPVVMHFLLFSVPKL